MKMIITLFILVFCSVLSAQNIKQVQIKDLPDSLLKKLNRSETTAWDKDASDDVTIAGAQDITGEKTFSNSKTVFSGDSVGIRGNLDVDGNIKLPTNKYFYFSDFNSYIRDWNTSTYIQSQASTMFIGILSNSGISINQGTYPGFQFNIGPSGSLGWRMGVSVNAGHLWPRQDLTHDIGRPTFRVRDIYARKIILDTVQVNDYRLPVADGNSGQTIKTDGSGNLYFADDITESGTGVFDPDGTWIDTTAFGEATISQAVKDTIALVKTKVNRSDSTTVFVTPTQLNSGLAAKQNAIPNIADTSKYVETTETTPWDKNASNDRLLADTTGNGGNTATRYQLLSGLSSKLGSSDIQLFIDTLYRSNDTIYFVQKDGSTLFFVDNNTGGDLSTYWDSTEVKSYVNQQTSGDTSNYTVAEIDSLLGLAGSSLQTTDVDDVPVNGATTDPISSNWAYDHLNDANVHQTGDINGLDAALGARWDSTQVKNYVNQQTSGDTLSYPAEALDSLMAGLDGGATGQIPRKKSNARFDLEYFTPNYLTNSDIQLFVDTLYRSNDTIYFVQKDGSTLFFVDATGTGSMTTAQATQLNMLWAFHSPLDTTASDPNFPDSLNAAVSTLISSKIRSVTPLDVGRFYNVTSSEFRLRHPVSGWTSWYNNTASNPIFSRADSVQVRDTSSASGSTQTLHIFFIGSIVDTFLITTIGNDTIPSQFTFTDVTDAALNSYNTAYIVVAGCDSARFYPASGDTIRAGALGTKTVSPIWVDVNDTLYTFNVASGTNSTATHSIVYSSDGTPLDTFTVTTVAGGSAFIMDSIKHFYEIDSLDAGSVTDWYDAVRNYRATALDTAYRPIKTGDALMFDGTDFLRGTSAGGGTKFAFGTGPITLECVFGMPDTTNTALTYQTVVGANYPAYISIGFYVNRMSVMVHDGTNGYTFNDWSTPYVGTHYIAVAWDGVGTNAPDVYLDGVLRTDIGNDDHEPPGDDRIFIGGSSSSSEVLAGSNIPLVVLRNLKLNSTQVNTNYNSTTIQDLIP